MDGLWRPTNLRESCYAYSCHSRLTLASGATALDSVVLSRLQREEIIWDWIRGWRAKRLPPATILHAAGVKKTPADLLAAGGSSTPTDRKHPLGPRHARGPSEDVDAK